MDEFISWINGQLNTANSAIELMPNDEWWKGCLSTIETVKAKAEEIRRLTNET